MKIADMVPLPFKPRNVAGNEAFEGAGRGRQHRAAIRFLHAGQC